MKNEKKQTKKKRKKREERRKEEIYKKAFVDLEKCQRFAEQIGFFLKIGIEKIMDSLKSV